MGRAFRVLPGLQVHHIDYDKNNNAKDNLILLCNKHHGQTSHRREYWQSFFHSPEFLMVYGGGLS